MLQAINGGEAETYLNGGEEAKKTSSKRPQTEKMKTREGERQKAKRKKEPVKCWVRRFGFKI